MRTTLTLALLGCGAFVIAATCNRHPQRQVLARSLAALAVALWACAYLAAAVTVVLGAVHA